MGEKCILFCVFTVKPQLARHIAQRPPCRPKYPIGQGAPILSYLTFLVGPHDRINLNSACFTHANISNCKHDCMYSIILQNVVLIDRGAILYQGVSISHSQSVLVRLSLLWPILINYVMCYYLCVLRWLMRPILALNCLLQIEQERSEEESSVGDAFALAFRCARFWSADSFCFVFTSSPFYEASPLCTILCNLFPWLCWYVEVFKEGFEGVLV